MREQLHWLRKFLLDREQDALDINLKGDRMLGRAFGLEVRLCHNDLLSGNILRDQQRPAFVHLIDYEYAAYNHRAFDLANHFSGMSCL